MNKHSPYAVDRYTPADAPRGVRSVASQLAAMVGALVGMGALCLGMLYLLSRVAGR